MRQLLNVLSLGKIYINRLLEIFNVSDIVLVLIYVSYVKTQTIYACNFDTATSADNCFTTTINVGTAAGIITTAPPTGPQSDVTASCKRNSNYVIPYISTVCLFLFSEANN